MKTMNKTAMVWAIACGLLLPLTGLGTKAQAAQAMDQPLISKDVTLKLSGDNLRPGTPSGISRSQQHIKIAKRGRKFRSRRRWRRGRYRHRNRDIAIGVGIAILGIIAAETARSSGYKDAMWRCERDYRSFDWETGTYITHGGTVRLCPYLVPYID